MDEFIVFDTLFSLDKFQNEEKKWYWRRDAGLGMFSHRYILAGLSCHWTIAIIYYLYNELRLTAWNALENKVWRVQWPGQGLGGEPFTFPEIWNFSYNQEMIKNCSMVELKINQIFDLSNYFNFLNQNVKFSKYSEKKVNIFVNFSTRM